MNEIPSAPFVLPGCPLLPAVEEPLHPLTTRQHGEMKCSQYYEATLKYAQSLWRQGKPAQAILQINKSFMAHLNGDEPILLERPPAYAALVWILKNHRVEDFIGNPVRHFQHLATRVSGQRKELRSWRAWACFRLSKAALPGEGFPVDEEQVKKEGLAFPAWEEVVEGIGESGWRGEVVVLTGVMEGIA